MSTEIMEYAFYLDQNRFIIFFYYFIFYRFKIFDYLIFLLAVYNFTGVQFIFLIDRCPSHSSKGWKKLYTFILSSLYIIPIQLTVRPDIRTDSFGFRVSCGNCGCIDSTGRLSSVIARLPKRGSKQRLNKRTYCLRFARTLVVLYLRVSQTGGRDFWILNQQCEN